MKDANKNGIRVGYRRLLSLFLCLVMLTGILQFYPAMAVTGSGLTDVTVRYDGEKIENLTLPENDKAELTADCTPVADGVEYRWQI